MRIRRAILAASGVPLLGLTACTSADPPDAPAGPVADVVAPSPSKTALECVEPTADLVRAIMAGGLPGWGTLRPEGASAWKSPGTEKVYFIAIRFRAENLGPETGVWVSDSLSADREVLMSLDEAALRATTWPNASIVDTSFGPTMTGVKEARTCLGP